MTPSRIAWALWAVLPVFGLAYHYGPGQTAYLHDRAVDLHQAAQRLEQEATALQSAAYDQHLAALDARRAAQADPTLANDARSRDAAAAQTRAFAASSAAWKRVADAFGHIQEVAQNALPETLTKIRWSRSRALVRAGDIWNGIGELEGMLTDFEEAGRAGSDMARMTREELATAYYYSARLSRLSGEPAEDWMVESGKARQHFRYLAEQARAKGLPTDVAVNQERNVELVLDLEQSSLLDIQGKPLPKDSPSRCNGKNPGGGKKTKIPPRNRDGRGAGGAEEVNTGW